METHRQNSEAKHVHMGRVKRLRYAQEISRRNIRPRLPRLLDWLEDILAPQYTETAHLHTLICPSPPPD